MNIEEFETVSVAAVVDPTPTPTVPALFDWRLFSVAILCLTGAVFVPEAPLLTIYVRLIIKFCLWLVGTGILYMVVRRA